jgi:hypothetical protein
VRIVIVSGIEFISRPMVIPSAVMTVSSYLFRLRSLVWFRAVIFVLSVVSSVFNVFMSCFRYSVQFVRFRFFSSCCSVQAVLIHKGPHELLWDNLIAPESLREGRTEL